MDENKPKLAQWEIELLAQGEDGEKFRRMLLNERRAGSRRREDD